jgi:hypothetical protein
VNNSYIFPPLISVLSGPDPKGSAVRKVGGAPACDWKQHSRALPDEARVSAPYIRDRNPVGCYPYCLPAPLSACNLLPEVRAEALERFAADSSSRSTS